MKGIAGFMLYNDECCKTVLSGISMYFRLYLPLVVIYIWTNSLKVNVVFFFK